MSALVQALVSGRVMDAHDAEQVFAAMLRGEFDEVRTVATLVALRVRGECPAELAGAARALLAAAPPFPRPPGTLADSCGTGGDGASTINISTGAAFVAAACGLPVAKHGNRAVSSRCGSADVLAALGARMDLDASEARRVLDETGVCFLFAPAMHPGLARVMPVRRALGTRTIFNALGPLVNPARPDVQLVGVYDPALCVPMAETLGLLGVQSALVVHGAGLDELALHAPSVAARLVHGRVEALSLAPEDFGIPCAPLVALAGGGVAYNADALRSVLEGGGRTAHRDAVILNAAALLWIAGRAPDPASAADLARAALEDGRVARTFARFLGAQRHA